MNTQLPELSIKTVSAEEWRLVAERNVRQQMKIEELKDELKAARYKVSLAINVLQEVKIALEEDDHDEALRIITEATT